jgi:hypothetical protein
MSKHTPGKLRDDSARQLWATNGQLIAGVFYAFAKSPEEGAANAARLAHCWNCHDDLVEALEACLDDAKQYANAMGMVPDWYDKVKAALAAAGGEE